jgi:hypothetical protein
MASEWKSEAEVRNDRHEFQIRMLIARIERASEKADYQRIPDLWELGTLLTGWDAEIECKMAIAKRRDDYYRSIQVSKYFLTLDQAKAYQGSLRQLLKASRKGIEGREVTAVRFDEATKRIRKLVEYLWRRMPGRDRGRLPELLDDLKGQYQKLYRQADQDAKTRLPNRPRSIANEIETEAHHA